MAKITDKQKRFCEEYLIDMNGTQAAIRAGYSKRTANEQAARLLANVSIQVYLNELREKLSDELEITRERIVSEFAKIAFFDIRKIYTVDGGLKSIKDFDDESAAAIAGIKSRDISTPEGEVLGTIQEVKITNKIDALNSLVKIFGYNAPEKKEVQIPGITDHKDKSEDDLKQLLKSKLDLLNG